MPLLQLPNQIIKIISLAFFAVTSLIKLLCIFLLNGQADTPCIAGWHVNEELAQHLSLLSIGLIPDLIMLVCIGIGMAFKSSNIGADPSTIIYNFCVGLLTVCCLIPFLFVEDCMSKNLAKIKSVGVYAAVAGLLQISNGIVCLLTLAPEERFDADEVQPTVSNPRSNTNSAPSKSSTSKASK